MSNLADKYVVDQAIRLRDVDILIDIVTAQRDEIAKMTRADRRAPAESAELDPDDVARAWGRKKLVALMIEQTCGKGCSFSAWRGVDGERRVYINLPGWLDGKKKVAIFYVTGSSRVPPGKLVMPCRSALGPRPYTVVWEFADNKRAEVLIICEHISSLWSQAAETQCIEAINYDGDADAFPQSYLDARSARLALDELEAA